MVKLDSLNSGAWALSTNSKERLRVHFSPFIVFTIGLNGIWLALDKDSFGGNRPPQVENSAWRGADDYPEYKKHGLLSRNIMISIAEITTSDDWGWIKRCHYIYLDKIAQRNCALNSRTRKNHSRELNERLRILLSNRIPFPSYIPKQYSADGSSEDVAHQMPDMENADDRVTEKDAITKGRLGQDDFRERLIAKYGKCVMCGIENRLLLRASHIKTWAKSDSGERLDVFNGLLLCASHDACFDSGLITFNDDGTIVISGELSHADIEKNGLVGTRIVLDRKSIKNMKWHRENKYRK